MTLIRLEKQKTDLVICINVPHVTDEYDKDVIDFEKGNLGGLVEKAVRYRDKVLETLRITDWGLFGEDEE